MENFFKLKQHGTNVKTEILAGITTFMTMAYILMVNPGTLAIAGMDIGGVFTATALAACVGTLVMALYANLPFALAPGMGLNAFFAFTVVLTMGYSWQFALTAVFLEGIIFIILTFFNIREAIINCIPQNIKKAISVGIGLFIAFIGLSNAGVVVQGDGIPLHLGTLTEGTALLAIIGILLTGLLLVLKVKGALFIGILATTIIGIPMGITTLPADGVFMKMPPSLAPVFFKFDFANIFSLDMLYVLFVFLFVDMFDTVGTLVGVSTKAGMLDKDGNIPNVKRALFADAIGTTVGAVLGTSTVTTYVESASGVADGGRTGLTSFTVAILFLASLFFAPIFVMVPAAATASALVLVGLFMMSPIKEIDFEDFSEAIPAFLTFLTMPLAYSIADGIAVGMISYVVIKILSGKFKDIKLLSFIVAVLFVVKFIVG